MAITNSSQFEVLVALRHRNVTSEPISSV